MRRPVLVTLLAAGCGGGAPGGPPPNVLLISIDTVRADVLGCYGNERESSPVIDALAERGVRFADCSSTAPWTLPAHASLFTGTYPRTHGVKSHERRLDPALPTLATRLQEAGYETRAIVNTYHLGEPRYGLQEGFRSAHYVPELEPDSRTVANCGREVNARAFEALAEIRRPFFLFLHYFDAHSAYRAGSPYDEMFVEPYEGPLNATTRQLARFRQRGRALSEADARFLRQRYEAEVRRLDDLLEQLLARLEELGLARNTLVVLTSDHGEEFGERGGSMHGRTQYQEVLHVPWIVAGPGVAAGRVVEEPVSLVDVAPTILGYLGLEEVESHEGLDLAASLRGGSAPAGDRILFSEADHENWIDRRVHHDVTAMARAGDWKLCHNAVLGRFELYDLGSDPGEEEDRYGLASERARRLEEQLRRFIAREDGGIPIPPPGAEARSQLDDMGY